MFLEIEKLKALEILDLEGQKIKQLITNQQNYQCITQCKAFEEVVDTQMYGFSKQLDYAQKIGILSREESTSILVSLEKELNKVYGNFYDEKRKENERK